MKRVFTLICLISLMPAVFAATKPTPNNEQKSLKAAAKQVKKNLEALTPAKHSVLSQQQAAQKKLDEAAEKSFPIALRTFKPNYILPAYFTGSPAVDIYQGNTPDDQPLRNREFKFQVSFQAPIWQNMFGSQNSLNIAYTQMSYWQVYTRSPYFRETNYQPEVFLRNTAVKNWEFNLGAVHQSNGRGGELERSWNRAYADVRFSGDHWLVSVKPWLLIFKSQSSDFHNPDIAQFLGHGRFLFVYKPNNNVFSLMLRNVFEHGGHRVTLETTWSYPLTKYFRTYVQFFSGYGQSLIEYRNHTNSIGFGVALNDYV